MFQRKTPRLSVSLRSLISLNSSYSTGCPSFRPAILQLFLASSGRPYDAGKPELRLLLPFRRLEMPLALLSATQSRLQLQKQLPMRSRLAERLLKQ